MGVRDVYFVLFKHKWKILVYYTIILVVALAFSFLWPPSYESTARVLLEKTTSTISDPSLFPLQTTSLLRTVTGNEEANNEIQIARSRPVLEKVVRELHLDEPFRPPKPQGVLATIHATLRGIISFVKGLPRWLLETLHVIGPPTPDRLFEKAVNKLGGDLKLSQIADSDVLMIRMKGWYPDHITKMVNAVTLEYLDFHLKVHQGGDATDFYWDHLTAARGRLEELEGQLVSYRRDESIVNYDKTETVAMEKIEILERELVTLRKQIISERAKVERMRASLKNDPQLLVPSTEINSLDSVVKTHDRLMDKELERGILLEHYTADHPKVQALDKEVEEIQKSLRDEVQRIVDLEENQLATWEDEERAIEQTIVGLQDQAARLPQKKLVLTQIQRSIDEAKGLYEQLLKKREDARLNLAQDPRMVKVRPITMASIPTEQSFPDLFMNMLLSSSLGLVAAVALAFLGESVHHTFRDDKEVLEHLGLPALAALPESRNRAKLKEQAIEAIKSLKHALDESADGRPAPRSILFASAQKGEGTTTVASLFAEVLAEYGGQRVVLVDGDVPDPCLHKLYGVQTDRCLLDLLRGQAKLEDVVVATRIKGLSLLPGDAHAGGGASHVMLEAEPMSEVVSGLRSHFDTVVMDGAPIGSFADTSTLAGAFDATVLIVKFDKTGWTLAERVVERLRRRGARLAGVVLTHTRSYIPKGVAGKL